MISSAQRLLNLRSLLSTFQAKNPQLPNKVKMVEVGPRDGLQNEKTVVETSKKIEFVNRLSQTGLPVIETTSFVSKKWVPQMGDAEEVFRGINKRSDVSYPVLVPNVKGLEAAIRVGVKEIAVFGAASETFSQNNINCSIDESLQRFAEVVKMAQQHKIKIRGYVSCVMGCPYEGEVRPQRVAEVTQKLFDLGCYEVSLGDTIGKGTPDKTKALLEAHNKFPISNLAVHFHDTYDSAIANILVALEHGVAVVDSSVAGLGGCPYAKKSTGNVCSENVLYALTELGVDTGVDLPKLKLAGQFITELLARENHSFV